jgi:cell wall-associated NlpC family hydrolase
MNKKFAAIGTIVLITTSSGAAFAQMTDLSNSTTEQVITQVTKPTPIINSQVTKEVIISGPVKSTSLEAGPVLASKAPLVGSVDWMAQEKADKDKREADAKATVKKIQTEAEKKQAELESEIARLEKIANDTKTLNETLFLVKKQIGKTPWYFGGSTPNAWDCSGMIRWTYAHLGVDLLHSASAQRVAGKFVNKPKIGDLVSFSYQSYGSAYHIGIYIGPDEMIHAGGKPGDRTAVRSIREWQKANGNSDVTYTRIIETNN